MLPTICPGPRSRLWLGVVVISLLVGACTPAAGSATQTPALTLTMSPTLPSAHPTASATLTRTATLSPSPTATLASNFQPLSSFIGCEGSAYVSDVTIPDGSELAPDEVFVKTWQLKNTGTCPWRWTYSMSFIDGEEMNGSDTQIDRTVNVGETADISVPMIAPDSKGTYAGYWMLTDDHGIPFGVKVYVKIKVSQAAASATPSPAKTRTPASASPSPTLTITAAAASVTPVPTDSASTPPPSMTPGDTPLPSDTPTATPTSTADGSPTAPTANS